MLHKKEIQYAGLTDVGRQRTNNEDLWLCRTIWNENYIIAAVIDGIGGYEGGGIAAQIAAEKLVAYLEEFPNGERSQILKEAMVHANNCIYRERVRSSQYMNMGCVMTAVLIGMEQGTIDMVHIGDTRLYELSEGAFVKLSHDQSPVGRYEEWGVLSEKEAMEHPMRNVIEQDLGNQLLANNADDYIEIERFFLKENTTWLLCSDGLTDLVTKRQIQNILESDEELEELARHLVGTANAAGGKDNITVVLFRIRDLNSSIEIGDHYKVLSENESIAQIGILGNESQTETNELICKRFQL